MKVRTFFRGAENGDTYGLKLVGTWGLTRQDELRVSLPLHNREYLRESRFGPGDLYLRYKRSLHQEDGVMTSDRFALLLDGTLPPATAMIPECPLALNSGWERLNWEPDWSTL